jgi:hypothetical protein
MIPRNWPYLMLRVGRDRYIAETFIHNRCVSASGDSPEEASEALFHKLQAK